MKIDVYAVRFQGFVVHVTEPLYFRHVHPPVRPRLAFQTVCATTTSMKCLHKIQKKYLYTTLQVQRRLHLKWGYFFSFRIYPIVWGINRQAFEKNERLLRQFFGLGIRLLEIQLQSALRITQTFEKSEKNYDVSLFDELRRKSITVQITF